MPQKGFPRASVRGDPGCPNDRVYHGSGSGSKKGKEGVKALLFRRVEVGQMIVKDAEPKLRPILPEVGDFAFIKPARS